MRFLVNGQEYELDINPETRMVDVLRRHLGLTGTKLGCGDGQCGACTILVERRPVRACVYPARRAAGKEILTIEGLAASYGPPDELHPLQQAFIEHGALQCGYCTPGMLMAAASLWDKLANPEEELPPITDQVLKHVLGRNACRCTGYGSVLRAFRSAIQAYETGEPLAPLQIESQAPMQVIGRTHPRPDIVDKVTGRARYTDDLSLAGMLHGATLRAAHPHARILGIDTGAARALPGVHTVLTHRDVPGANRHGLMERDWPVLCDDKVRYLGDAVAIVAADTPKIAARALELVEVRYERLPVVASPAQARRPDAPLVHPERTGGNLLAQAELERGDLARGWAEAEVTVEREYQTPFQDHLFMEPECSIGVPAGYDEEHDRLTVYTGSQRPLADQEQIAAALGRTPEQVRVVSASVGGSFGGKEDIMGQIHAALLAAATGRPVKILYHRVESLLAHPKRHAMTIRIKTGARRDGALTAVEVELTADAGAYASLSGRLIARAVAHAAGPFTTPHVRVRGTAYHTNNPPAGAFRGLGVGQVTLAVEQNMDILAQELGLSPFELRRRNHGAAGDAGGLRACLDWVERKMVETPAEPTPEHLRVSWGVAAAYRQGSPDRQARPAARVAIELLPDGRVELRSASSETGQGLNTLMAQCAAEELGLPFERVRVLLADTGRHPAEDPRAASRQATAAGIAARQAARELRERLVAVTAARWQVPREAIAVQGGYLSDSSRPQDSAARVPMGTAAGWLAQDGQAAGLVSHHEASAEEETSYGVQAAQVEVDTRSGKVRVLRLLAASDIGRVLNPQALLGQMEGGLMMGIGGALTEEYRVEDGIPQTLRWADYQVPLVRQIPEMALHFVEQPAAAGPYGAKGVGELSAAPTAAAICSAIFQAVGVRPLRLPVQPDWLVEQLNGRTG